MAHSSGQTSADGLPGRYRRMKNTVAATASQPTSDGAATRYGRGRSGYRRRMMRNATATVGRRRVRRLMRLMGLEAIYRKPRTSVAEPDHRVYPYLLRGLTIDRPNQVWCSDITYIPVSCDFLYLVGAFPISRSSV